MHTLYDCFPRSSEHHSSIFCPSWLVMMHSNFFIRGHSDKNIFLSYISHRCIWYFVYRNYLLYKWYVWIPFLFILIDMFMLYRCMKSLRWYNILTRQRVSTKYKISVYLCKQTYQSEELRKTITCLTWLLHFIIIDHLSRCMRIKAANNVIVSTKLGTELLSLCFNTDNTCTSSFVVFKYK